VTGYFRFFSSLEWPYHLLIFLFHKTLKLDQWHIAPIIFFFEQEPSYMSSVLCWWYFTYIMSEHEHNDDKRKFVVDTLSEKVKLLGHWFKFKRSTCAKVQSVINDPDDLEHNLNDAEVVICIISVLLERTDDLDHHFEY
jgi:hypothetical protein